jgi:hypothetical protein
MKVCIIGGFPRAGTRQFTDIMNEDNNISIRGEVHYRSFRALSKVFQFADMEHDGKWSFKEYSKNRTLSVLNGIAGINKGFNTPFDSSKHYLGFKSPRIEVRKKILDSLFKTKIHFFFCARNIIDNYLSNYSVFNTTPRKFIQQTVNSINKFIEICKDDKYDENILYLDDFIESKNKGIWLKNNIFSKLPDCDVDHQKCESYYNSTTNRNATVAVGKKRIKSFNDGTINFICEDKRIKKATSIFYDQFGIDLTTDMSFKKQPLKLIKSLKRKRVFIYQHLSCAIRFIRQKNRKLSK